LLAEHISGASRGDPTIKPAITPISQAEARDLPIICRRMDQPLPASTLLAPPTCEGRMKGHLHLIVQIEISVWHKREQLRQIGGKLIPQISLNQVMHG